MANRALMNFTRKRGKNNGLRSRNYRLTDIFWVRKARNRLIVRENALNFRPVGMGAHLRWSLKVLLNSKEFCWIVLLQDLPVFVIQASKNFESVRWGGYGVNLSRHPIGVGSLLPTIGISLCTSVSGSGKIRSEVTDTNIRGSRLYDSFGVQPVRLEEPVPHRVYEMDELQARDFQTWVMKLFPAHLQEICNSLGRPEVKANGQ